MRPIKSRKYPISETVWIICWFSNHSFAFIEIHQFFITSQSKLEHWEKRLQWLQQQKQEHGFIGLDMILTFCQYKVNLLWEWHITFY